MSSVSSCYCYLMNPFCVNCACFITFLCSSQVGAMHLILSNYQEKQLFPDVVAFCTNPVPWFSSVERSWQSFHGFTSLVMLFSSNSFKVAVLASWSFFKYSKYCRFDCAILPVLGTQINRTVWPEFNCPEVTLCGWQDIKIQLLTK